VRLAYCPLYNTRTGTVRTVHLLHRYTRVPLGAVRRLVFSLRTAPYNVVSVLYNIVVTVYGTVLLYCVLRLRCPLWVLFCTYTLGLTISILLLLYEY
jgi:hypothetical protein